MGDRLQGNTPKESGGLVSLLLSHLSMLLVYFSCCSLIALRLGKQVSRWESCSNWYNVWSFLAKSHHIHAKGKEEGSR